MAWYIAEDFIDSGDAVGEFNCNFREENTLERVKKVCKFKFRMYDDDGVLYYSGYSNDSDSEKAFAPLEDFGMPNAGCTEIKYWEQQYDNYFDCSECGNSYRESEWRRQLGKCTCGTKLVRNKVYRDEWEWETL